jgi:hypothetical protein
MQQLASELFFSSLGRSALGPVPFFHSDVDGGGGGGGDGVVSPFISLSHSD